MSDQSLAHHLIAVFLAPDEGLPYRLGFAALGTLVLIRALYVAALPRTPVVASGFVRDTPIQTAATDVAAQRRWWPTREDRLVRAISLVRAETDLTLSKTDAANATLQFARARAELAAVLQQLQPSRASEQSPTTEDRALSRSEMEELIDLVDLDERQRAALDALIQARLQERSS